jgi:hypothetical protein
VVAACNAKAASNGSPSSTTTRTAKVRADGRATVGKTNTTAAPHGTYAIEINTNGCGLFSLDTGTMVVTGDQVTIDMVPADGDP